MYNCKYLHKAFNMHSGENDKTHIIGALNIKYRNYLSYGITHHHLSNNIQCLFHNLTYSDMVFNLGLN